MHHDVPAGASQRFFKRIGIADIKRQPIGGEGVHLAGRDRVKSFGNLTVAFFALGPQLTRPAAHRIGFQKHIIAGAVLFPDLDFGFFFISPNDNRGVPVGLLFRHQSQGRLRHRCRCACGCALYGLDITSCQTRRQSNNRKALVDEGDFDR